MKFKFFIGGYHGNHFEVVLQKEDLCFFVDDIPMGIWEDTKPNYIISIKQDEDWQDLIKLMESLKWKRKYCDNEIMDGTQWKLVFKSSHNKLNCYGSNEYPEDFDAFINRLSLFTKKHKIPFKV